MNNLNVRKMKTLKHRKRKMKGKDVLEKFLKQFDKSKLK